MIEGAVAVEKVLTDYSPCLKITESAEKNNNQQKSNDFNKKSFSASLA